MNGTQLMWHCVQAEDGGTCVPGSWVELREACLFFFFLFRATPAASGSSQARGQIRAAAAGLYHSHTRSELHARPLQHLVAVPDS